MALALSILLGTVAGLLAARLWSALGSRLGDAEFWPEVQGITTRMLGDAQLDFLREYGRLLRLLARYLGKMLGRVGLSMLPVVAIVLLAGPLAVRYELRHAAQLRIYPEQPATLQAGEQQIVFDSTGAAALASDPPQGDVELVLPDATLTLSGFQGAHALSNSTWSCLGLELLGLSTQHTAEGPSLLILRAADGSPNPLWPWLGNLEFAFWSAVTAASLLSGWLTKLLPSLSSSRRLLPLAPEPVQASA